MTTDTTPALGECDKIRREATALIRQNINARRIIEKELSIHGGSRHPLVDALLDVRNALRDVNAE